MKMQRKEITIKDTERAIYDMYLQEKDNRFVNAFKILLLRRDFYDFLNKYRGALAGNPFGIVARQNKGETPKLDWGKASPLLEQFLEKIKHSEYVQSLGKRKSEELLKTTFYLLGFYYPYYIFARAYEVEEKKSFIHDKMLNFPKTYHKVFYAEDLEKYRYGELNHQEPPISNLTGKEKDKRRVLQITCADDVGKEELKQYIDEYWNDIALSLNQSGGKEREKASKNFLRDVDLYNRYISMTHATSPTREYRVANEAKAGIDGDYIRKLIFDMTNLEKDINKTKNDREK